MQCCERYVLQIICAQYQNVVNYSFIVHYALGIKFRALFTAYHFSSISESQHSRNTPIATNCWYKSGKREIRMGTCIQFPALFCFHDMFSRFFSSTISIAKQWVFLSYSPLSDGIVALLRVSTGFYWRLMWFMRLFSEWTLYRRNELLYIDLNSIQWINIHS